MWWMSVRGYPMAGMTDDQAAASKLDRLVAAGLSPERIEQHMTASRVRVDGEPVDDLDAPAPAETRGRSTRRPARGTRTPGARCRGAAAAPPAATATGTSAEAAAVPVAPRR